MGPEEMGDEEAMIGREEMLAAQHDNGPQPFEFMGYDEEMLRLIVQDFERRASEPMEAPLPPPPGPGGTFGAIVPPIYIDVDGAEQATDQLRAVNERAARINRTQEEWEAIYQAEEDLSETDRLVGMLQNFNAKDVKWALRALHAALYSLLARQRRDLMTKRDRARGE